MIHFRCPVCGQPLRVADDRAGKDCRCARCSSKARVPDQYSTLPLSPKLDPDECLAEPVAVEPPAPPIAPPRPLPPSEPSETPRASAPASEHDATMAERVVPVPPVAATLSYVDLAAREETPSPALAIAGYEVVGELGRGGMGVVYQARQTSLKRLVALKMIRDTQLAGDEDFARFQVEAEALASLQHPNIVQIYEIGNSDGLPYFSLELVEGGSLAKKLAGKPMGFREAAELTAALARAVHSAHQRGVIHRDLKPANVLMTPDGTPKITDFGLAKQMEAGSAQTHSSAILGTPSYMAPEQAAGNVKEVGPPSDTYSLGAILYELLTGRPPFRGPSAMKTVWMVIHDEVVPPGRLRPKLPRDLETICLKCLEKEPSRRYATAGALAYDLERWLEGEPILARPMSRTEHVWRWCRRNPLPASLLLAVTIGAIVGLWHLTNLSEALVRSTALDSAALQAEMLDRIGVYYSTQVVDRAKKKHVEVTHDYLAPGKESAIPVPATLQIELGQMISAESAMGQEIRMYSDHPFMSRTDGGPRDAFEETALQKLRANPREHVYQFEEYKGQPVLRFAVARVMRPSCVECHNHHEMSPKRDWKEGDVRGALEIIHPLGKDVERAREGLRGTFILVGGIAVGLLGLSTLLLVLSNRRASRARTMDATA